MRLAVRPGPTGPLLAIAFAILLASLPGQSADRGPGAERADELHVAFALPTGIVREVPSVDVLFNRPMRALGTERRGDEAALLKIEPPQAGRHLWVGSRALRFVPERALPRATTYRATVPAGIRDASGKALAAPAAWTFSTPAPAIVRIHPPADSRHLEPAGPIVLVFNQPVDPGRLCQAVAVKAGGTYVAATCAHPDSTALAALPPLAAASRDAIVLLRPKSPLPRASAVTVHIAAEPVAVEGPLPLTADTTFSFTTIGPLSLVSGSANASRLTLVFSNPVHPDSLRARLRLSGPAVTDSAPPFPYGRGPETDIAFASRFAPGRLLRVWVGAGLRDAFGQTLAAPAALDLVTQDLEPMLEILPEHAVIEAKAARRSAVVRAVNVRRVTVRAAALKAEQAAVLARRPWMMASGEIDPFAGIRSVARTHRLDSERNHPGRITVDLSEFVRPAAGGFVLLCATSPDRFERAGRPDSLPPHYSLVQITDLGLMTKVSAADILVWATSLSTGEPLAQVDLEIRDEEGALKWRGRTGSDGLARGRTPIPWQQAAGWTLIGRRGRDQTILGIDTDWDLSPWAFDLPGDYAGAPVRAESFLFTDRELFRPGETVHVKAIVRGSGENGLGPAPLDSVRLRIMDPYGNAVLERALGLSAFGSAATDLLLAGSAPLGYYWAHLEPIGKAPGEVELRGALGFRVEAFRPAAFKVDLDLSGPRARESTLAPLGLVRGDSLLSTLTARTFFDAPLSGAAVNFVVRRERAGSPLPAAARALADYSFTDPTLVETDGELVATANTELDSRGEARISTRLDLPAVATPQSIEVEAQAFDQGGRVVAGQGTATWFPAALLLGVRVDQRLVALGQQVPVSVVTTALDGSPLAGTEVRVEWIEREWHTVMRQMVGGRLGYDSELVETVLDSALVETTGDLGAPAAVRFTPRRPGSYAARVRAADRQGRGVRSADFAYAAGPGFVPWSRETGNRLTLIADRAAYSPGDTATLLVESPFPSAQGLLTIEREGIREVLPFTAESTTPTLRIPLGESAVPNLFASVALVRGSTRPPGAAPGDTLWSKTPEFRLGYILLPVKPDGRELLVQVTAPEQASPGDSVAVRIAVTRARDGAAADAEVTLMLVDEAVLRLLGTQTPDPFAFFYRPQGLGVMNAAKALQVVAAPEEKEKGLFPGGGGGDSGRFRRLFAATAAYFPTLLTGPDGVVEARFRLPDNLTTFRAMAVACDRTNRLGHGEAPLTVTRPLVLDPVVPRLARAGDAFMVGAVLTNRSDKKLKVRADFDVEGPALETAGKTDATVTIEPGRSRRVDFPVRARAAGETTLRLTATAAGKKQRGSPSRDAVSFPFRVEDPLYTRVAADYGVLAGPDSLAFVPITIPANADPDRSFLAVQVSTSLAGGIEPALTYLLEYPHGCLEQIASRLIGLAVAKELAPRLILTGWDDRRREQAATKALAEIAALSHYDGGYRVWPEAGSADPYLSAYALLALFEARDAGIPVDEARCAELARYLKERFDSKRPAPPATGAAPASPRFETRFETADALTAVLLAREARSGRSPGGDLWQPADLERLAAHQDDLDRDGLLLLAAALNLAHPFDARVGQILGAVTNEASMTGGRAFIPAGADRFATDEMTTALALRVLLAAWSDHPLVTPMARWLATERDNGTWRTTHATAHAALAMRDLARLEAATGPEPITVRATIAQAPLFEQQLGGTAPSAFRFTMPLAERAALAPGTSAALELARLIPAPQSTELAAAKPVYHMVRLSTGERALVLGAAEEGLILERKVYPFDPLEPQARVDPAQSAETGAVVRLELTLVVPRAATDVAIADPLPAGLEPLILDLDTVARTLGRGLMARQQNGQDNGPGEANDIAAGTGGAFPAIHVERRDDRVVAFAPEVPAGIYRFEYLARAATPGVFSAPPAAVELMYDPEVRARTAPLKFTVMAREGK